MSIRTTGTMGNIQFSELVSKYDVIIMKHCFPSSDIIEDSGMVDPCSSRQSPENYKAVYRLLRNEFDNYPDKLFIIWTLPPRHRLYEPIEGDKYENAARATAFSNWLLGEYLSESGSHPNIYVWDFRSLVTDPDTGFLEYEYELSHRRPDSHPNKSANNTVGPRFARFIVDSIEAFYTNRCDQQSKNIVFLHHSTGGGIYQYPSQGLPSWFDKINATNLTTYNISEIWYPSEGNMPVHYYRCWLENKESNSVSSLTEVG